MKEYALYADFAKPYWAPPAELFGQVWTVLYVLIFISFGYVFYRFMRKKLDGYIVLPFALNIIFNLFFTPILFGIGNFWLATLDILLVLGTLIWAVAVAWRKIRWVAYMNIPYLLWVIFATILQLSVTFLNT